MAADAGEFTTAVRFYFAALAKGSLPPPLAAKALAQICLRRPTLRKLERMANRAHR
jgi:hypothetical protein